ncbi:MAG: uroporphyrinogen decarboxylase family protein [Armatimonadota bacterium]|jgi:uroporphyrinogen decarboxylase
MTNRERVHQAIQFRATHIVPHQVEFTVLARQKFAQFVGDPDFEETIGNHLAVLSHRRAAKWIEAEPGHLMDEWGVIWNRTIDKDIGVVENQVLPEASLREFAVPNPASPEVIAAYPGFIERNRDRFRMAGMGMSLFERAWSLRGMDNLLVDMLQAPRFVHELLDRILEFNLAQLDLILSRDIDAVHFGDDWGSQGGLIMGPALWREFIKPRIAQMYAPVRQAGKRVSIHCCGDVKEILPDLVEVGLDLFNPFQPETMDVFETKKRYCGQLSFYGGISLQHLLPHGTPDQIRSEVKVLLSTLGEGGGYIASPSHAVTVDVPCENLVALIEVFQDQ